MGVTVGAIYNQLLLGDRIKMSFSDAVQAERFRIRLSQWKLIQERAMISIGGMEPEDRQVFVFRLDKETGIAILKFDEARSKKQYEFEVISSSDTSIELEDTSNDKEAAE